MLKLLLCLLLPIYTPSQSYNLDLDTLITGWEFKRHETTTPKYYPKTNEKCTTGEGDTGACVVYYNCEQDLAKSPGLIDIHFQETICDSYLDVCCNVSEPTRNVNPTGLSESNEARANTQCGYRNINGIGVNFNSDSRNIVKFGEFPWTVAILRLEPTPDTKVEDQKEVYLGGGTLIHPSVVLTAAHVIGSETELLVRAGDFDSLTTKEIYPHQDIYVDSAVTHHGYNKKNLKNDVSLLFLKSPFDLTPNVGLACLPAADRSASKGEQCLVSGWNKGTFGDHTRFAAIQNKVEVMVVEHEDCEVKLRQTRLGRRFTLHESFMCASGVDDESICKAAGGSPLVCPDQVDKNRYVLNGMVAWNINCLDSRDAPGVYVNVANYRSWINENVQLKGFDTHGYDVNVN